MQMMIAKDGGTETKRSSKVCMIEHGVKISLHNGVCDRSIIKNRHEWDTCYCRINKK